MKPSNIPIVLDMAYEARKLDEVMKLVWVRVRSANSG
jgi:hypothetical protein